MLQREVERDLGRKQGRSAGASSRSNWPTGLMSQPKPSVAGFLLRTRSAPRNVRTTRICGCLCGDGALPRPARRRTRSRRLCCRRRVHHRTTDYRLAGKISAFFIIPGGFVVHLFLRIETGEQPVVGELKPFLDDEGSVRVIDEIVFGDAVVFDGVPDDAAEEGDVGAGADLYVHVRGRGGAGQTRIDNDGFRVTMNLGFYRPLEAARVI